MPASSQQEAPPALRHCMSVPDQVQEEDLEDLMEEDLFTHTHEVVKKESKSDVRNAGVVNVK